MVNKSWLRSPQGVLQVFKLEEGFGILLGAWDKCPSTYPWHIFGMLTELYKHMSPVPSSHCGSDYLFSTAKQECSQNQGRFTECMKLHDLTHFYKKIIPHLIPPTTHKQIKISKVLIKQIEISKMYSELADARERRTEQLAVFVQFVKQEGIVRRCFLTLQKLL